MRVYQSVATSDLDAVADNLLLQFVQNEIATAPAEGSKEDLAVAIAKKLRWEPQPDRNPPRILIMKRGSKVKGVSNMVASISRTGKYAHLYPSWEPVLQEWARLRDEAGGSKVSHKTLGFGSTPGGSK